LPPPAQTLAVPHTRTWVSCSTSPLLVSLNKLEDMDQIRQGEIQHIHFQDGSDMPPELRDNNSRFISGDGVSPLTAMLRKLADKGYAGPLSVELFLPKFQKGNPYEIAREIRQKRENGNE